MRVGNSGWSGWIDEYGIIRGTMRNKEGSIYYRGSSVYEISRDRRWVGRLSLYMQWGDWFVALSAALVLIMVLLLRSSRLRVRPAPPLADGG